MAGSLVQYIVVRTDLISSLGWTTGAVIAQACHATTAAALEYRDDEAAQQYYADVDSMHKIVLGIGSEAKLRNLSKRLTDFYIPHRVWTEQPENIPTCLVTKPAPKTDKAEFFRKLQLFRTPSEKSRQKHNKNGRGNSPNKDDDKRSKSRGSNNEDKQEKGGDEEEEEDERNYLEKTLDDEAGNAEDFADDAIDRMSNSPKLPPIGR